MIFNRRTYYFLAILICSVTASKGQGGTNGFWQSHLPYNSTIGIATNGNVLFTACRQAFFTIDGTSGYGQPIAYSKAEGMSDLGMQCVAYDGASGTTVLVYSNGNIDLFKESDNTFYNVPDFKIKSTSGSKAVSEVYTENGFAYICTSLGVLVLDLTSHDITENYQFIINNEVTAVRSFIGSGDNFYAVTSRGIYSAAKNNPQLQNFQVWNRVDTSSAFTNIVSTNNVMYLTDQKSVYTLINDTVHKIYSCPDSNVIKHIDAGITGLLISEYSTVTYRGKVKVMSNGAIADSFSNLSLIVQAVQLLDSTIWLADYYSGLMKLLPDGNTELHVPVGPADVGCFDIYAHNKEVWVAHGGYNNELYATPSNNGVSSLNGQGWKYYRRYSYAPLNNIDDFVALAKNESTGTVYMGSFLNGLFTLNADGTYEELNKNSIFDTSSAYFGDNQRQVAGVALDKSNNLWVSTIASLHQLYVKTTDGAWSEFIIPGHLNGGPMVVDDHDQVWFASLGGGGVVVYDAKGTFDSTGDDWWYNFTSGVGSGNLPSNRVFCVEKDKNNNIWVGTDNGIGIISNCSDPGPCDAQIPIVQYDQFAGYLFAGNNVRTIAVDGANRKWVGTDDGVWLLSSNADKIIYRFTEDNSPLPSNHVRKIYVDKITGDVYIGTDNGLIAYRSTATEGAESNSNVKVFPNPVLSSYSGNIAIKGLVANSDVRITDINGQLVYRTTSLGGQAIWNGKDYTGHRPQSGVYLVFVSNTSGDKTYAGKIVFTQ